LHLLDAPKSAIFLPVGINSGDPHPIPKELLDKAEAAQKKLGELPEKDRAKFINDNAEIWRSFKEQLSKMSYGKCWYSESPADQTFHDV